MALDARGHEPWNGRTLREIRWSLGQASTLQALTGRVGPGASPQVVHVIAPETKAQCLLGVDVAGEDGLIRKRDAGLHFAARGR